ncbi:hypothetical protein Tco_0013221 [Tanacetum coccineum]
MGQVTMNVFLSNEDLSVDMIENMREKISKKIFVINFLSYYLPVNFWIITMFPLHLYALSSFMALEFNNEFCENSSSDEESMEDEEFNSQKVDDIDHISESSWESKDAEKSDPSFPPGFTPKGVNETIEEEENMLWRNLIEIGVGHTSKKDGFGEFSIFEYKVNFDTIQKKLSQKKIDLFASNRYGAILFRLWSIAFCWVNLISSSWKLMFVSSLRLKISRKEFFVGFIKHMIDLWDWRMYHLEISMKLVGGKSDLVQFSRSIGLILIFPSLAAICLDRRLSDHMPILLRESSVDYGPTPFRVFHSWFTKDGFDNLIADAWNNLSIMEITDFLLRRKFQALKAIIKNWSRDEMLKASAVRHSAPSQISELDKLIDKGLSNNDIINERISILKDIHDLDKQHSFDLA